MIAAFFDIDGTIYRDSLMIEHFKKLIKYEVVDPIIWHEKVKKLFGDWQKRQGDYDDYILNLGNLYIDSMKGINKDEVSFIVDQVIKLKGDKVYKFTREKIKWHKKQGHKVIFISGSPDFLVEKMAKKYNADDNIGTAYKVDDNHKFTGEVHPMWDSVNKSIALENFVNKYDIDLSKSFAYGDTHGDITMFEAVGNPIAINPAKELLNAIKTNDKLKEKIDIVVERKDVIYRLKSDVDLVNI